MRWFFRPFCPLVYQFVCFLFLPINLALALEVAQLALSDYLSNVLSNIFPLLDTIVEMGTTFHQKTIGNNLGRILLTNPICD